MDDVEALFREISESARLHTARTRLAPRVYMVSARLLGALASVQLPNSDAAH